MDWLNDYEDELRLVFQESRRIISEFPEPLNQQGMSYLEHFNVFNAESHKTTYVIFYPFGCRRDAESLQRLLARCRWATSFYVVFLHTG